MESYAVERGMAPVPARPCVDCAFERVSSVVQLWWGRYCSMLMSTSPPGANKTDWAPAFPFVREIAVSPLICLDSYHPSLLHTFPMRSNPGSLPQVLVIPAAAPTGKTSELIFKQAQRLSTQHEVPSVVCASTIFQTPETLIEQPPTCTPRIDEGN